MFNLVKMDRYRFVKGMWLKLAVAVIIYALFACLMQQMTINQGAGASIRTATSPEDTGFAIALDNGSETYLEKGMDLNRHITENGLGGGTVLLAVVPIIMFSSADNKKGFRKNIAGAVSSREHIALAKFISTGMITLAFLTMYYVFDFAIGKIILGDWLRLGDVSTLIYNFVVQYLLLTAFSIFAVAITMLVNSAYVGLLVTVLLSLGMSRSIYTGINYAITKFVGVKGFNIGLYSLESWLVGDNKVYDHLLFVTILAIVWILVWSFITTRVFSKRDVR
ncbi:ABC transporter permease [Peptostreptococcus anaerobius]|uniref:ABC transporter permease n=1 Tax=Peptostreptococcus anaerobius TaxID=1261 RepID=UPI001D07483E|nr:ABC transporter permease [Peptostreptococcus anaerobius]MCB6982743.1 ABC transporter permease [Peptostreptococcus anaerobius]MCQ5150757.1 ABC transporter permease [Peptostreptococcus anaerobius]